MKKTGNKNLKIIAATSMAIFSLLTTFTAAFAWFVALREETEDVDNIDFNALNGKLKNVYFHKFASAVTDPTTLEATSVTFNTAYSGKISYDWETKTASYDGDASIKLAPYTPLDPEHPILMVFELEETYDVQYAGDIKISGVTDVEGYLGARNSETGAPIYNLTGNGVYYSEPNAEDPSKTDYYFALSSVIDFLCSDTSNELYYKSQQGQELVNTVLINPTYTISSMRNRDMSIAAREADPEAVVPDLSFTSINNVDDTTSFKQKPTIYTSQEGTTVKYISIIVDYYRDAVEYIYSTYLGNNTLEGLFQYELNFLCDWGLEVI